MADTPAASNPPQDTVETEPQIDQDSLETAHTLLGLSTSPSTSVPVQPYADHAAYAQWAASMNFQLQEPSAPVQPAFQSTPQFVLQHAPVASQSYQESTQTLNIHQKEPSPVKDEVVKAEPVYPPPIQTAFQPASEIAPQTAPQTAPQIPFKSEAQAEDAKPIVQEANGDHVNEDIPTSPFEEEEEVVEHGVVVPVAQQLLAQVRADMQILSNIISKTNFYSAGH